MIYDVAHKEMGGNICGSINDVNNIRQHVLSRFRLEICKLQFKASMWSVIFMSTDVGLIMS